MIFYDVLRYWILDFNDAWSERNTKLTSPLKNLFFFFMALKKAEMSYGM